MSKYFASFVGKQQQQGSTAKGLLPEGSNKEAARSHGEDTARREHEDGKTRDKSANCNNDNCSNTAANSTEAVCWYVFIFVGTIVC